MKNEVSIRRTKLGCKERVSSFFASQLRILAFRNFRRVHEWSFSAIIHLYTAKGTGVQAYCACACACVYLCACVSVSCSRTVGVGIAVVVTAEKQQFVFRRPPLRASQCPHEVHTRVLQPPAARNNHTHRTKVSSYGETTLLISNKRGHTPHQLWTQNVGRGTSNQTTRVSAGCGMVDRFAWCVLLFLNKHKII